MLRNAVSVGSKWWFIPVNNLLRLFKIDYNKKEGRDCYNLDSLLFFSIFFRNFVPCKINWLWH